MTPVLRKVSTGLATMSAKGVPQVTAFTLGILATGIGALFLTVEPRFVASPVFDYLLRVASPSTWGLSFYGVGIALAAVSVVAHHRAHILCGIAGILLFVFAILLALPAVGGTGTGLTAWLALGLGWVCLINATSHFAPNLQHWLEVHDAQ